MLHVGTRSKNFFKISEKTSINTEDNKYSDNNIFGRYVYDGLDYGGDFYVH